MPIFEIEQYEIHTATYRLSADSEADAIAKLFDGDGEFVDNSQEYIETCEDLGLPVDEYPELADQLRRRGIALGECVIPSIRSIEQLD